MLEELGIRPFEERVYRAVLRRAATTRAELAGVLDAGPRKLGRALAELEELGLIRRSGDAYAPVHPDSSINMLIHRRRAGLDEVRGSLGELVDEFRLGNLKAHPAGPFEILVGVEAIYESAHLDQLPTSSIMTFDRPPYAAPLGQPGFDEIGVEAPMLQRGVEIRAVYAAAALQPAGRLATIMELARLGEQARTVPELPVKFKIIDRRIAIMMLADDDNEIMVATVIQRSPMLDALIALFEAYWVTARPVLPGPEESGDGELDEDETLVVGMLGAGLTDQAIARNLNVSLRTARRRISSVMEKLNVTSRFQAGAAAARRGWI